MSSVDGMVGVSYEAGGEVFDPLGLAELHTIAPLVQPHPKVQKSGMKFAGEVGSLCTDGYMLLERCAN